MREKIDSFFGVSERGSDFGTEIRAGIVVFLSMCYILMVNPDILGITGMDKGAVFTATAISAIVGSAVMALYARFPIALAPGMGMNAFFTFTVVMGMGFTWQQALAAVFISGLIFLALTAIGARGKIIEGIPKTLRISIAAGIGMFVVFIGLQSAGIIVNSDATLVALGDFSQPAVLLAIFCIVITLIFHFLGWKIAILAGMVLTAIVGMVTGVVEIPAKIVSTPSAPPFGAFLEGFSMSDLNVEYFIAIFTMVMLDMFDSTGTILSIGDKAGLLEEDGTFKDGNKALAADAVATVVGGVVGTSSVTSYVESATGVESGGRTGIVPLVVCAMFALALFFSPLFIVIGGNVTVAALLMVGVAMFTSLENLDWLDPVAIVTVVVTVMFMVLTYSITDGMAFGFIVYVLGMVFMGRGKEVSATTYVVVAVFVAYVVLRTVFGLY